MRLDLSKEMSGCDLRVRGKDKFTIVHQTILWQFKTSASIQVTWIASALRAQPFTNYNNNKTQFLGSAYKPKGRLKAIPRSLMGHDIHFLNYLSSLGSIITIIHGLLKH